MTQTPEQIAAGLRPTARLGLLHFIEGAQWLDIVEAMPRTSHGRRHTFRWALKPLVSARLAEKSLIQPPPYGGEMTLTPLGQAVRAVLERGDG